jgi:hypothetical protein
LRNSGAPDGIVELSQGSDFPQRLSKAGFTFRRDQAAYAADRNNWAGRFGAASNVATKTIFRAGYGLFYDRPYDKLFLNPANSHRQLGSKHVCRTGVLESRPLAGQGLLALYPSPRRIQLQVKFYF